MYVCGGELKVFVQAGRHNLNASHLMAVHVFMVFENNLTY